MTAITQKNMWDSKKIWPCWQPTLHLLANNLFVLDAHHCKNSLCIQYYIHVLVHVRAIIKFLIKILRELKACLCGQWCSPSVGVRREGSKRRHRPLLRCDIKVPTTSWVVTHIRDLVIIFSVPFFALLFFTKIHLLWRHCSSLLKLNQVY